jgi:ABC transporter substrate binding protein (PQQ-dependent alcohol dehydrogenase system)
MTRLLAAIVFALFSAAAFAAEITVGFLSLDNDPRHDADKAYARIELKEVGNALAGAQLGLDDSAMLAEATGNTLKLDAQSAGDVAGLVAKVEAMAAAGQRFIVVDLPGDVLDEVAAATADVPVTLINATAPEDVLRNRCYPNLLHTAASDRMLADAMVQFLRDHDWLRVLVLVGEEPRDRVIADSFTASAQRYRLNIVAERPFTLAADPQNREENNILLLTGGIDYDVVYIADSDGEFGRYLPYATQLPRPVIGSTGLIATEWHWGLERYGAPQVTSRFASLADGKRMGGADWSAWMAAKAVATAYARARSEDPAEIDAYLRGSRLKIDGSKGVSMNFREWDGQLRQPLILATHNAVIAIPPLAGFLHQTNDLDTLGTDQPEHRCL